KVTTAALARDGSLIAAVVEDADAHLTARVIDAHTGQSLRTLDERGILTVTFSPNSRLLVTTSTDRTAHIWDPRTGALLRVLQHRGHVVSASFSKDGKL